MSISPNNSSQLMLSGMISGINTQQVIQTLMLAVEQPKEQLLSQQNQINTNISDYQTLNSDFAALQTAADAISSPQSWQAVAATTSNATVATASTTGTGSPGSVSFTVSQLAQSDVLASANTVSATSDVVASGNFLMSVGGNAIGIPTMSGSSALTLGNHTIQVTQALSGASYTGTTQVGQSTTITTGVNDTINATVNGVAQTFTIAAGTYTAAQLAKAVSAASGSTPLLQSQVTGDGYMQVGTTALGSASTLQVTGGNALASLGMAAQGTASTGTAGSITVDGTATSINNVNAGSVQTLTSGTGGTVSLTMGNFGTTVGTVTADNLSSGNGSLASVVSAINNSGLAVTASAVQTSTNSYRLQISSNNTGVKNNVSMDPTAFSSTLGNLNTITAGQDAQLQVGSGTSGYQVDSSTNTVSGLMPGLTITALQTSTSPVTATLAPDSTGLSKNIQAMVDAANKALADIQSYAGYNAATKTAGPLMGDGTLTSLTQQVLSIVGTAVGGSNGSGGNLTATDAGLALSSTGSLTFSASTFQAAFAANPSGIAQLFSQGGSFAASSSTYNNTASFVFASDGTQAGSYAINISKSASQATDLGTTTFAAGATVTAGESISITSGANTASYTTQTGDTLQSVANGLNKAFAQGGLGESAQVFTNGAGTQQLEITSAAYGSAASFTVATSGGSQFGLTAGGTSYSGVDVAGTINGVAATGTGQILTAPQTDPTLAGLSLQITAKGITTATALGTFTYSQGIGGGEAAASYGSSNPVNGNLTTTIQNLQQQSTNLGLQAAAYDPVIAAQQRAFQNEFAQMEATLASLKNQNNWLSGQIKQLP